MRLHLHLLGRLPCTGLVALVILSPSALPAAAKAPDWKKNLEEAITGQYQLTKRATFAADRITAPGTVLVVQQAGITGDLATNLTTVVTKVIDGKLKQSGLFAKEHGREFKAGDRVYLIGCDIGKSSVQLHFLSHDTFQAQVEGTTKEVRYKGALVFEFADDYLETADFAAVKKTIDPFLLAEDEATAVATKTIELGQTPGEVESILGRPGKVINLKDKTIYVYDDMKVIFVEGTVADVQ